MTSPLSDILLYLTVCGKGWLVIYLCWLLLNSALTSLSLHLMMTGLCVCLVAYFKLPSPDDDLVRQVLGEEMEVEDQENTGRGSDNSHPYTTELLVLWFYIHPGQTN